MSDFLDNPFYNALIAKVKKQDFDCIYYQMASTTIISGSYFYRQVHLRKNFISLNFLMRIFAYEW